MSKLDIVYELFGEKIYTSIKIKLKQKKVDYSDVIKKNEKFKNIHEGERCFVLGNGPSLREENLSLLSNEIVFTVNNFARIEDFKVVKPDYHLWVDDAYFEMRDDNKMPHEELMYNYCAMAEVKPICFVPAHAKSFIEKNKIDEMLEINYFDVIEWVNPKRHIICELNNYITGFTTVVQYAIVVAIYMGFKEIYLLGCDTTNIMAMLNIALNRENFNIHAYDVDDAKERYRKLLDRWNMTDLFNDQYTLFLGYRRLNEECKQRGIKIVNLSQVTLIDEIERDCIKNIL